MCACVCVVVVVCLIVCLIVCCCCFHILLANCDIRCLNNIAAYKGSRTQMFVCRPDASEIDQNRKGVPESFFFFFF